MTPKLKEKSLNKIVITDISSHNFAVYKREQPRRNRSEDVLNYLKFENTKKSPG